MIGCVFIQRPRGLTYPLYTSPSFIPTRPVQVRFHGKTSGLHLLGRSDRTDHRNEGMVFCRNPPVLASIIGLYTYLPVIGGVWHLPRVRKWPPR